jgi:hypothetical protein
VVERLRHDLFEELDAFNPRWQSEYRTIEAAAKAAGALELYQDWLRTEHGQHYLRNIRSAHDHAADNERRKAQREAELAMATRGRTAQQRGYVIAEDALGAESS